MYVSPNLNKEETARRVAEGILSAPVNIMCSLCKAEHQLLEVFVTASANAYVVRKIRKTLYKLQKFGLVLTYEDDAKGEWHMLMPDSVRDSLADFVPQFMNYINADADGIASLFGWGDAGFKNDVLLLTHMDVRRENPRRLFPFHQPVCNH